MSLFDTFKEKASELLTGASDKVSELTGIELPGAEIADQLTQTTDQVTQTAGDLAGLVGEAGQNLADTAQNLGATATDAATGVVDPHAQR